MLKIFTYCEIWALEKIGPWSSLSPGNKDNLAASSVVVCKELWYRAWFLTGRPGATIAEMDTGHWRRPRWTQDIEQNRDGLKTLKKVEMDTGHWTKPRWKQDIEESWNEHRTLKKPWAWRYMWQGHPVERLYGRPLGKRRSAMDGHDSWRRGASFVQIFNSNSRWIFLPLRWSF